MRNPPLALEIIGSIVQHLRLPYQSVTFVLDSGLVAV